MSDSDEIERLRAELAAARAEARMIVEAIPLAVSRRAALRSLCADLVSPSAWWSGLRGFVARLRR
ncbi:MAG: hypothetical protein WCI22_15945 [Actinomycetota bacterium]